jgi:hypothetical protein
MYLTANSQPAYDVLDDLAILDRSLLLRIPIGQLWSDTSPHELTARHNDPMTADLCAISAGPNAIVSV